MAVQFGHPRRPLRPTALADPSAIVGILGVPTAFQLGKEPQVIVKENPRRLGVWLQASGQAVSQAGQATGPAAGILVTPALKLLAGTYDLFVSLVFVGGAPVAADAINWQVLTGSIAGAGSGSQAGSGPLSCPAALNQMASRTLRVVLPTATSVVVAAIAAATAGVVYQAEIVANALAPALVGLDKASLGGVLGGSLDGQRGWPIAGVPMWLAGEQELWAIANSLTQPSELRIWEVSKEPRGRTEIAPDGSLLGT